MNDWSRRTYEEQCGNELTVRRYRRPRVPILRKLEIGIASEEEVRAYEWLRHELLSKRNHHLSSRNIFGVIGFDVPIGACNPDIIEQIMAERGIPLVERKNWYDVRTGRVVSVAFTYDTPEVGIINTPI